MFILFPDKNNGNPVFVEKIQTTSGTMMVLFVEDKIEWKIVLECCFCECYIAYGLCRPYIHSRMIGYVMTGNRNWG